MDEYKIKELERDIQNYKWMMAEWKRIDAELRTLYGVSSSQIGERIGGYVGGRKDPVGDVVIRRTRKRERLEEIEDRISRVNQAVAAITSQPMTFRDETILECMLDGLTAREIAANMKISVRNIHYIRRRIATRMIELTGA